MKTIMYSRGVDCESEPDSEVLILDIFYTPPRSIRQGDVGQRSCHQC